MSIDFKSINGVHDVAVSRDGNTFHVSVFLDRFESDTRRRVYAKELQLWDNFPGFLFDINVFPSATFLSSDSANAA